MCDLKSNRFSLHNFVKSNRKPVYTLQLLCTLNVSNQLSISAKCFNTKSIHIGFCVSLLLSLYHCLHILATSNEVQAFIHQTLVSKIFLRVVTLSQIIHCICLQQIKVISTPHNLIFRHPEKFRKVLICWYFPLSHFLRVYPFLFGRFLYPI
jgi:hypothetical protein